MTASPLALPGIYAAFMLLSLTGALSPGPLTTMAITEGARSGRWAGVRLALGHGLVEIPLVFAIAYGLGAWLQQPALRGIVGLVGAAVLLWMGYGLVVGAWRGELRMVMTAQTPQAGAKKRGSGPEVLPGTDHDAGAGQDGRRPTGPGSALLRFGHISGGLMLTLTNPYWSFWWATVGAGRITEVAALSFGPFAIAGLALTHWLTDLGWLGGLSWVTASGRGLIGDRVYRGVLIFCGLFLIAFGGYLAWSGVGFLIGG